VALVVSAFIIERWTTKMGTQGKMQRPIERHVKGAYPGVLLDENVTGDDLRRSLKDDK